MAVAQQLPQGSCQAGDRHLKIHETRDNLPPSGGTGLWVDTGTDAVALAERGRRRGVRVVPGAASSVFGGFGTHLRLPYWHPAEEFHESLLRLL